MIQSSPQGSLIKISGEYRAANGSLVNPTSPVVTIYRPDGTVAVSAGVPARLTTGIFVFGYLLEQAAMLGIWRAVWTGTFSGTAVTSDDVFEVTVQGTPEVPISNEIQIGVAGTLVNLDVIYRVGSTLTDPTSPLVTVHDPSGATISVGAPTKLATGVYRYPWIVPNAAISGLYNVVYSGTLGGGAQSFNEPLQVISNVAAVTHIYGTTVFGIMPLVPQLIINDDTTPSLSDVAVYLDSIGARVSLVIGDPTTIPDAGIQARVIAAAKDAVSLGAAAMAWDEAHPEMAAPNQSGLGAVLWSWFEAALKALAAAEGIDPGDLLDDPAWSFPPTDYSSVLPF